MKVWNREILNNSYSYHTYFIHIALWMLVYKLTPLTRRVGALCLSFDERCIERKRHSAMQRETCWVCPPLLLLVELFGWSELVNLISTSFFIDTHVELLGCGYILVAGALCSELCFSGFVCKGLEQMETFSNTACILGGFDNNDWQMCNDVCFSITRMFYF